MKITKGTVNKWYLIPTIVAYKSQKYNGLKIVGLVFLKFYISIGWNDG